MNRIFGLWIKLAVGMMLILLINISANAQPVAQWVARYDGPAQAYDNAQALAVDAAGNTYVTGISAGNGTATDYATIKYDAEGNQLWVARYDGPAHSSDWAYAVAVDASGNVYVTGGSSGSGTYSDFATVKYDANGNQLWVARYDGPAHGSDYAVALKVDAAGNVYVTGASDGSSVGSANYATIKYDTDGNQLWVARYDGPGVGHFARALAVDATGNVYVTGSSAGTTSTDYATVKYDANGTQLWVARYDGPAHAGDGAWALAVDTAGNVYVTGNSDGSGTNSDYATVKYSTDGNQLWVARYDGPAHDTDSAQALAVDTAGNVYVTGYSYGIGTSTDYATVKYGASGNQLWVARYDGPAHAGDGAFALAVDAVGNVYVTGNSAGSGTNQDYATLKYDASGNQLWVARYDGPAHDSDAAMAIAVDAVGNVYVTGDSYGTDTSEDRDDYATIKYVEDSDGDGIPDSIDSCPNENATGFDVDHNGCIDSVSGLSALVSKLVDEGGIDTTMQYSLLSKLANAENSTDRDSVCAAINILEAFKRQVSAQSGKKISGDSATEVVNYANSIIAYQRSLLSNGESCQ